MKTQPAGIRMITKTMFRLLPVQVLLAVVSAVNGVVSSFFASNFLGVSAMSAVGLFSPFNMLMTSVSLLLVGGTVVICGKYLGMNQREKLQGVFSLNLLLSILASALFIAFYFLCGTLGLTGFLTRDPEVRPLLNAYMLGQAIGVFPLIYGNQLPFFLALENKGKRTTSAGLAYIAANILFNFIFLRVLHMKAFGLALATALGLWVFLAVQAQVFAGTGATVRISLGRPAWREGREILKIGFPGAASNIYQTLRGLITNNLLQVFVGSAAVSAFAASDNLMRIFWAIPTGMQAVARLMMSVSYGEEDRQTLTDIMRVVFRRYIPLMCVINVGMILCAVPMARVFFRDPAEPVYQMTVLGFRLLPLCMPTGLLCMQFLSYGQISGKQGFVNALAVIDGVICVAGFTALLVRPLGMVSIYIANILNGICTTVFIVGYAAAKKKRFPRNMDDLMAVPESFGVPATERMDLSIQSLEEVVTISRQVQDFCEEKGIEGRRAYLAGLAMEEMAGNIVEHGFTKDKKKHSVDVRVVHKDGDMILRLKDDCVPFDPGERQKMTDPEDPARNIGIRMIFRMARDVQYQNIVGMNVLTIRV